MGCGFSKESEEYNHSCKQCIDAIENAQEMMDILHLRWTMTPKHEQSLKASLEQYDCEYIIEIILFFLEISRQKEDASPEYHAYFHCNISSLYNKGKAPCSIWLNQQKASISDHFKVLVIGDHGVGKSSMLMKWAMDHFVEGYEYGMHSLCERTSISTKNTVHQVRA